MVRNIEAAMTGSVMRRPQKEIADTKKLKSSGGKVARVIEGIG
jgi:hypothetical protein